MSRSYQITVVVSSYDNNKISDIVSATTNINVFARQLLDSEKKYRSGYMISNENIAFRSELIYFSCGPFEKCIAEEMHNVVWKANGRFCKVSVKLFYPVKKLVSPSYYGRRKSYIKLCREKVL